MPAPEPAPAHGIACDVQRILAAVDAAAPGWATEAARAPTGSTDAAAPAAASSRPPTVLIDGFSGAGKSTIADAVIAAWPGAQLVRLEAIYPGWEGLEAASAAVHDHILIPVAASRPGSWQRWDWTVDAPAERHPVDPERPLVIEGAGALSRANHRLAALGVWVDLDAPTRRSRALARDGAAYAPHWERWAAQERAFSEREHPRENADLVISRPVG